LTETKKCIKWIKEIHLVSEKCIREIGPAANAVLRLPNYLLSQMVQGRYTAAIATELKGKITQDEDFN
jgi:hypothetical protein